MENNIKGTIPCKHCGHEIAKTVNKCPHCGGKQKKSGCLTALGIFLGVIGIFMIFSSCESMLNSSNEPAPTPTYSPAASEVPTTNEAIVEAEIEIEEEIIEEAEVEEIEEKIPIEEEKLICEYSNTTYEYLGVERMRNMADDDCIGLFFNFTNNDNENRAAAYVYQVQVFQDGVELDFSIFHVNDESKDSENEIQKGVTLKVCDGFVLRSGTSTAHVIVKPWISFNDKPLMEFDIEIPQ